MATISRSYLRDTISYVVGDNGGIPVNNVLSGHTMKVIM